MGGFSSRSATVSGLSYYVWEVPGKPISIQLPFDVIDRMSPEILRGFGALKRRGAEVGGILLGTFEEGERLKVAIEDFEAVQTEYLTGPSYNLSENDLVSFEAALERRRSDPLGGLTVVGFYRSHTRDELYMDDADLSLASRYFPGPENVFLLVKPFASRPCIGGFFFWEDGEIYRQSSYAQFPFHRKELGGGDALPAPSAAPQQQLPVPASAPVSASEPRGEAEHRPLPPYTPAAERMPAPEAQAEAPPQPEWQPSLSILDAQEEPLARKWKRRWLMAPAFLVLAGGTAFLAYRTLAGAGAPAASDPPSVETTLPLKLSVSEKHNQLEMTWDRNAPAIQNATRGVLSIFDGENRRDLELTGVQLRNGRVLYSRVSGDVNLRLEVFGALGGSVNESIRIVSTEAPAPTPILPPAPAPEEAEKTEPVEYQRKAAVIPRATPRRVIPSRPAAAAASAPPREVAPPPAAPAPAPEVELQRPVSRR